MGRLERDFGGIACEFGGSARLIPLLLNGVTTFLITWSSGIDVFSSYQQSHVEKCETVLKNRLKIYLYKWR